MNNAAVDLRDHIIGFAARLLRHIDIQRQNQLFLAIQYALQLLCIGSRQSGGR